jgi:hypothetical protein
VGLCVHTLLLMYTSHQTRIAQTTWITRVASLPEQPHDFRNQSLIPSCVAGSLFTVFAQLAILSMILAGGSGSVVVRCAGSTVLRGTGHGALRITGTLRWTATGDTNEVLVCPLFSPFGDIMSHACVQKYPYHNMSTGALRYWRCCKCASRLTVEMSSLLK